jgi:hypothetical protein
MVPQRAVTEEDDEMAHDHKPGKQPLPTELPPNVLDDQILNEAQAGTFLGVSKFTIRRLAGAKKLTPIWVSDRRKGFRVADLKAFAAARAA